MCVPGAFGGQKKASDPLELELWMFINHHIGVGNKTQVLCKRNKYSLLLSHLSIPLTGFFLKSQKHSKQLARWLSKEEYLLPRLTTQVHPQDSCGRVN